MREDTRTVTLSNLADERSVRRYAVRNAIGKLVSYFLCLAGSFIMLLPLAWLFRSSIMSPGQIFSFPPEWFPNPFAWQNYPDALTTIPFLLYFKNTLFILVPTVVGTVVTATLAAYGFSRLRWRGRDLVFNVLLTTLMLPYAITLIPTFLLWARLGLINTTWPLVLPRWFGGGIFYIFLLRQFFRTIPRELDQHQMMHPMGLEMAIHHFDLVRAIFDANALTGQVQEWNPARSPYRSGGAVEALFTMTSQESSFPFLYSGSLVTQGTSTPWGGLWRIEFDGGTIIADTIDGQYGLFRANEREYKFVSPFADESMAFDKSFNHFYECVRTGTEPWSSGADNLNTLGMVLNFIAGKTE